MDNQNENIHNDIASLSDVELKDLDEVFLRLDTALPDAGAEWDALCLKRRRHRQQKARRIVLWAIAACALPFVLLLSRYLVPIPSSQKQEKTEVAEAARTVKSVARKAKAEKTTTLPAGRAEVREVVSMVTVKTTVRQDRWLTLPDGSRVWLNAGSEISYPERFTSSSRNVSLKGEAFFKVVHNSSQPFTVTTSSLTTTDLGTSFLVSAYKGREPKVVLVEGSVKIASSVTGMEALLKPGQQLTVSARDSFRIARVNVYPVLQSTQGFFYYDRAQLRKIMADVGRWYGKTVVFEDENLELVTLHLVAGRHESLSAIVDRINRICGIDITCGKNDIIVSK